MVRRKSRVKKTTKNPGWLRRWFWAPVNHEENWAQTIFRVLGNLFRTALTLFVLFFGALLAAVYVQYLISQSNIAARPINFVSVSIDKPVYTNPFEKYSNGCTEEFPFVVTIENRSDWAMTRTQINYSVRKRGTSERLLFRTGFREQDHDIVTEIILSKESYTFCRRFPPGNFLNFDPEAEYTYEAEVSPITTFSEPEDWMYEELGVTR